MVEQRFCNGTHLSQLYKGKDLTFVLIAESPEELGTFFITGVSVEDKVRYNVRTNDGSNLRSWKNLHNAANFLAERGILQFRVLMAARPIDNSKLKQQLQR